MIRIFVFVLAFVVVVVMIGILVYNGQNGWTPEDKDDNA